MTPELLSRLFYTSGLAIDVFGLSFILWEISKRNALYRCVLNVGIEKPGKFNLMKAGLIFLIIGHILKFFSCWNCWA